MIEALDSLRDAGPEAALIWLGVFILLNTLCVPATVMTTLAGFICGFPVGALVSAIGRTTAAAISFTCSRTVARDAVARRLPRYPRMAAIDAAFATGGFRAVVLLRLSPLLPSTLSNWLLGATRIAARPFILGTALGTLPTTVLYSFLGAGLSAATGAFAEEAKPTMAGQILFWIGLTATAGAVWLLARHARRELATLADRSG